MLEVLVRGPHEKEEIRRDVARLLRCAADEIGWARETEAEAPRFVLDYLSRADGFRTQATLSFDPGTKSPIKSNRDFALALATNYREDVLILDDPANPKSESFHGLLVRPDGKTYRVPLHELPSGGMGIEERPRAWTEWTNSPKG